MYFLSKACVRGRPTAEVSNPTNRWQKKTNPATFHEKLMMPVAPLGNRYRFSATS